MLKKIVTMVGPQPGGGTTSWTAIPALFPHGIQSVVNQTGWRIFAHNKVWYVGNIFISG